MQRFKRLLRNLIARSAPAAVGLLAIAVCASSPGLAQPHVPTGAGALKSLEAGINAYQEGAIEVAVETLSDALLQGNLSANQDCASALLSGPCLSRARQAGPSHCGPDEGDGSQERVVEGRSQSGCQKPRRRLSRSRARQHRNASSRLANNRASACRCRPAAYRCRSGSMPLRRAITGERRAPSTLPRRQRRPRHLGARHRSSSHPPPRSSAALLRIPI